MLRFILYAVVLACASALHVPARAAVNMGLFDGFAKAFDNDDSLGARKSAGLSKEATRRTVTWVGPKGQKKTAQCVPGQQLRDVARGSGIPIRYDCQEGTCKTCEAMVNGGRAKICVARMPNKDTTIKYNVRF
jgi:ferredoxin